MFYLRLYGITHMVMDHSDSEREKTHCHHMGCSFRLAARVLLYASSHRQDNIQPVEHWLQWEIAQWVHPMKDRSDDPSCHEQTLLPWSYISLLWEESFKYNFNNLVMVWVGLGLDLGVNKLYLPTNFSKWFTIECTITSSFTYCLITLPAVS